MGRESTAKHMGYIYFLEAPVLVGGGEGDGDGAGTGARHEWPGGRNSVAALLLMAMAPE